MAKNANFVSHKKSKQIIDGKPKLPLASDIVEGEIAINFAENVETLSIKNESGDVVTFSSDNYYTEKKLGSGFTDNETTVTEVIEENERVISAELNDLNERKLDASEIDDLVGSGFTSSSITDVIIENEKIVSAALNDLNERKLDASAYTPIDLSNYYTKSETSGATQIANALGAKQDVLTEGRAIDITNNVISLDLPISAGTGTNSIIEGASTKAFGEQSHAEGFNTVANNQSEHASGRYNVSSSASTTFGNAGNTLFSVGNGTAENARHNAFEIRQNGDIYISSGGTNTSPMIKLQDNIGVDLSNYYTKSETSGKTEIANALQTKSNANHNQASNTITAMTGYVVAATSGNISTSDTLNAAIGKLEKNDNDIKGQIGSGFTTSSITEVIKENEEIISSALNDLDGRKLDSSAYTSTDKLIHETMNRRTRTDFTSKGLDWFKTTLKSAIADKSLEKYGLKVGDYCTATHDGKTYNYVIAGLNTMRGTSTPYRLNYDHVGIIVDTNNTHAWNTSNSTATSQNTHLSGGTWTSGSSAGYASCDLQYYLETTVLPNVESDLGSNNIKGHNKLYSTAVNTSGYNRFGSAGGCSSSWAWYSNQKICALSEVQVYGSIVWSSSGYDTGEACRQLDVFRVYNMNEIFEGRYPWLRDVASSSLACYVNDNGLADYSRAHYTLYVAALILFA